MNYSLSEALKYAVGEEAAFRSKLRQNPFDYTTHLVYADWLNDQGRTKEEAFRRAMGEWVKAGEHKPNSGKVGSITTYPEQEDLFGAGGPTHSVYTDALPEWAKDLPEKHFENRPNALKGGIGVTYWESYDKMEKDLAAAFERHTAKGTQ